MTLCLSWKSLSFAADSTSTAPQDPAVTSDDSQNASAPVSSPKTKKRIYGKTFSSKRKPSYDPDSKVKMDGRYRLIAAADSQKTFIFNDSNSDLQERNFRYLFGERLNNTYDSAIYDQFLLNVNFEPRERWNIYTQIVADPWSWVGTTGEQVQMSDPNRSIIMRYNLKYFGAFNSTLNESYRNNIADAYAFPIIKVHNGRTAQTRVEGFDDFDGVPGNGHGIAFTIPELDIDYEFRPLRKLWVDYTGDSWHARIFPLADERQALTTDDPLELSNHRDYWQQSPWLYQYTPIMFYSDRSVQRGHYSDALSFLARDSEGNRLVLLRGGSIEIERDRTYFVGTIAAPYTPWDEKYFAADNIPAALRLKHQVTDRLMLGTTYTVRSGLIDNSVADYNQVLGFDGRYKFNQHLTGKAEVAGSYRDRDVMTDEVLEASTDGMAYKGTLESHFGHKKFPGITDLEVRFTQMDQNFEPSLSRYTNTRDDHFWANHLSFKEYMPDLEHFRLGDGVDVNRRVIHLRWKETLSKSKIVNLADMRHVRKASDNSYKETVVRDELTVGISSKLTLKGLFRMQDLPLTYSRVEPFISSFQFQGDTIDIANQELQNVLVVAGKDPSRYTYSGGVQYILNKRLTAEGFYEVTNDVPDFPRVLLNSTFRDANDRIEGILTDHITTSLYGQGPLGGVPPYEYFTITRERLIYKPDEKTVVTFHSAQNGYKYSGGIDDNINHQGISVAYEVNKKIDFFMDYTHSSQIDLPKLIATNYTEHDYRDHHNLYATMGYRENQGMIWKAEYGVFGLGENAPLVTPYSTSTFSLPTIDTEHIFRLSLTGEF